LGRRIWDGAPTLRRKKGGFGDRDDKRLKAYEIAIPAESFARAVVFGISQPQDVSEILFRRPTRQEL
jgi:hypothetical protein